MQGISCTAYVMASFASHENVCVGNITTETPSEAGNTPDIFVLLPGTWVRSFSKDGYLIPVLHLS